MQKKRIALYPGTFDALTYGHVDIIQRASRLFDKLVVGVAHNPGKNNWFSIKDRVEMIRKAVEFLDNVEVQDFSGLTVEFAREIGTLFIVRGLRAISDFEFEIQLALLNRQMNPDIETVFLAPSTEFIFLSSSAVKDVVIHGGDVSGFVPEHVAEAMKERIRSRKGGHS